MNVVLKAADSLHPGLYSLTAAYRHRVFVPYLDWHLVTQDGIDEDQFDRPDTMCVVSRDVVGDVCGSAKLLPTTRPSLLHEVFSQLRNSALPSSTHEVWELSRFPAVNFNANTASALGRFSSGIVIRLHEVAIVCAAASGARRLITVSPIWTGQLARRARRICTHLPLSIQEKSGR